VEPTTDFKNSKAEQEQKRNSFSSILKYFFPYKKSFGLIFIIMLVVTVLQGMLPFISKAVIDVGIKTSDRNFINMVQFHQFYQVVRNQSNIYSRRDMQ